ncbi:trypsin-like peptidase domain-containing protein [Streptomyces decoyicus]|uniref:trypsin-like peptidase domain-containing protein n=1 Tax=Streptomyces decoyicus TaxID=249567 RepID=UPI003866F521|nr:trypsin-like peptidase domain-containing protein [Streptomyces decoyicus]
MDDGKAAGPKLKWWSRPGGTPRTEPSAEAGPQAMPPAGGPAGGTGAGASGASDVREAEDWIVRPPEPRNGSEAGVAHASSGSAEASEAAAAGEELTVARGASAADGTPQEESGPVGAGPSGARPAPSTVTLRRVAGGARDETRSAAADETARAAVAAPAPEAAPVPPTAPVPAETPSAAPQRQQPLHPEDPYGTPPYGGPGPWAPAPPVQRPVATPAHGTVLPPAAGPMPPYGAPAAPQGAVPGAGYPSPAQPAAPPAPPTGGPGATVEDRPPLTPPGEQPQPAGPADAAHPRPAAEPAASHGPGLQKSGPPQAGSAPTGASRTDAPQRPGPQPAPQHPTGPQPAPLDPAAGPAAGPDGARNAVDGAFLPHPGDGGPRPAATAGPYAAPPQPFSGLPGDHGPASAQGQPATSHGAWQQYDPWSAPLQGGPVAEPAHERRRRRGLLVAGAVALALLAGGIGGGIGAYVERYGGINDIRLPQSDADGAGRRPDTVAGIARSALPGVVTIHVRGSAEQGTGTGFVLDRQGHILTNNHVVQPAGSGGEISVTFSGGETAKAKVVGEDGGYDLAVIQVEGVTGLRPLTLGNSDSVQVGDPVVAIGAPFDLANTVTSGIISAKQRPITAGGEKGDGSDVSYVDALQTDAPINPGNSGGPLVDAKARVIGINSAIRAADSGSGLGGGGQGGSIGLGFAIPINQAKRVAEELINTGRATHPVIGVTLEMEYAGDGARVSEHSKSGKPPVIPGGPGAKAGIKAGDVITTVDGSPVHSGEELIVKIRSHRPGDTLALTLQRGGKERSVRLSLGSSSTG